jgi:hypothetical protein
MRLELRGGERVREYLLGLITLPVVAVVGTVVLGLWVVWVGVGEEE